LLSRAPVVGSATFQGGHSGKQGGRGGRPRGGVGGGPGGNLGLFGRTPKGGGKPVAFRARAGRVGFVAGRQAMLLGPFRRIGGKISLYGHTPPKFFAGACIGLGTPTGDEKCACVFGQQGLTGWKPGDPRLFFNVSFVARAGLYWGQKFLRGLSGLSLRWPGGFCIGDFWGLSNIPRGREPTGGPGREGGGHRGDGEDPPTGRSGTTQFRGGKPKPDFWGGGGAIYGFFSPKLGAVRMGRRQVAPGFLGDFLGWGDSGTRKPGFGGPARQETPGPVLNGPSACFQGNQPMGGAVAGRAKIPGGGNRG